MWIQVILTGKGRKEEPEEERKKKLTFRELSQAIKKTSFYCREEAETTAVQFGVPEYTSYEMKQWFQWTIINDS